MSKPNKYGYTFLSSSLEYQNPYMRVYKRELELPNGRKNIHWTVNRRNFSIVIPLFDDGSTLLVGQYRLVIDRYSWEFCMGAVDGLDFLAMAKQELKEETGYEAKDLEPIGHFYPANGWYENSATVFVAKGLSFIGLQPEETEFLQIKQCTVDKVGKMIYDGTIKDGPTIIAYTYLDQYRKNQR